MRAKAVSGEPQTGHITGRGAASTSTAFGRRGIVRKRGTPLVYGATWRRTRARPNLRPRLHWARGGGVRSHSSGSHQGLSGANPTAAEGCARRSLLRGASTSMRRGSCWTRWGARVRICGGHAWGILRVLWMDG